MERLMGSLLSPEEALEAVRQKRKSEDFSRSHVRGQYMGHLEGNRRVGRGLGQALTKLLGGEQRVEPLQKIAAQQSKAREGLDVTTSKGLFELARRLNKYDQATQSAEVLEKAKEMQLKEQKDTLFAQEQKAYKKKQKQEEKMESWIKALNPEDQERVRAARASGDPKAYSNVLKELMSPDMYKAEMEASQATAEYYRQAKLLAQVQRFQLTQGITPAQAKVVDSTGTNLIKNINDKIGDANEVSLTGPKTLTVGAETFIQGIVNEVANEMLEAKGGGPKVAIEQGKLMGAVSKRFEEKTGMNMDTWINEFIKDSGGAMKKLYPGETDVLDKLDETNVLEELNKPGMFETLLPGHLRPGDPVSPGFAGDSVYNAENDGRFRKK